MVTDKIPSLSELLSRAEAAHGVYEKNELSGVYDEEWAHWYAGYAIDHGIASLVGHPITPDRLAACLATTFVEFRAIDPKPTESWAAHTARRIANEL